MRPTSTKTPFEEALELEKNGFYAEALILLSQSLRDSSCPRGDVLFHSAWCIEQQEGSESKFALDLYEQSVELMTHMPGKVNAAFRAGWLRYHQKDYDRASEMFKFALKEGRGVEGAEEIAHQAMYWLAVCLEAENRFIDAIAFYREVRAISPTLDPEARLREMYCHINIADFEAALELTRTFGGNRPENFPETRYRELAAVTERERALLERCLYSDLNS